MSKKEEKLEHLEGVALLSKLKLREINKENKINKTVEFQGEFISIKPYLTIDEKNEIVTSTLLKSIDRGTFNYLKLSYLLEIFLIFGYTNILIDVPHDKVNVSDLHDDFNHSGLMRTIFDNIEDYDKVKEELTYYIMKSHTSIANYQNSVSGTINTIVQNLDTIVETFKKALTDNPDISMAIQESMKKDRDNG